MEDKSSKTNRTFEELSEAHRRGITVALTLVDETLCEAEEWARGRRVESVFYKERNELSSHQRQKILLEIEQMRSVLCGLRETLGLEPTVQDAGNAIRGKCAGLWEHVVELKPTYLRRYGKVPKNIGNYLDPQAERLIQGLVNILDVLSGKSGSKKAKKQA